MFVHTHCHYDLKQFNQDRFEHMKAVKDAGVEKVVVSAILPESNDTISQKLNVHKYPDLLADTGISQENLPEIYFAAGIHSTRVWKIKNGEDEK